MSKKKGIRSDLEKCEKEKEEYLNNWKRERADLLNYKKEESERMKEVARYNREDLILKILPIVDDFHLAAKEIPEEEENDFVKGLFQIKSRLESFLKKEGVERIDCVGKEFDPRFHEAVEMVDGEKSGIVHSELQSGYMIGERLIRPAKVRVTK